MTYSRQTGSHLRRKAMALAAGSLIVLTLGLGAIFLCSTQAIDERSSIICGTDVMRRCVAYDRLDESRFLLVCTTNSKYSVKLYDTRHNSLTDMTNLTARLGAMPLRHAQALAARLTVSPDRHSFLLQGDLADSTALVCASLVSEDVALVRGGMDGDDFCWLADSKGVLLFTRTQGGHSVSEWHPGGPVRFMAPRLVEYVGYSGVMSPDGQHVVMFERNGAFGEITRFGLMPPTSALVSSRIAIPRSTDLSNPVFSPDTSKLAYVLESRDRRTVVSRGSGFPFLTLHVDMTYTLCVLDLGSGRIVTIGTGVGPKDIGSVRWSPDGCFLSYIGNGVLYSVGLSDNGLMAARGPKH